jgi:5-methylcytosine-specific restriction endonuclease McrA
MNTVTNVRPNLNPEVYRELRDAVLARDGWKCQLCGTQSNLEVHHIQFRSRGGT